MRKPSVKGDEKPFPNWDLKEGEEIHTNNIFYNTMYRWLLTFKQQIPVSSHKTMRIPIFLLLPIPFPFHHFPSLLRINLTKGNWFNYTEKKKGCWNKLNSFISPWFPRELKITTNPKLIVIFIQPNRDRYKLGVIISFAEGGKTKKSRKMTIFLENKL